MPTAILRRPKRSKKPTDTADVGYVIPTFRNRRILIIVRDLGESLILGRMTEESLAKIRGAQQGLAPEPVAPKDPKKHFLDSLYFTGKVPANYAEWEASPGKWSYGITTDAVRKAIIAAGKYFGKRVTDTLKGSFFIPGRFIAVRGTPTIREDLVVNRGKNGRIGDLRYRAEFKSPWSLVIPIVLHHPSISPELMLALVDRAGMSVGVGSWRVQSGGQHGMFEVIRDQKRRAPLDEKWWDENAQVTIATSDSGGPPEPKPAPEASPPTSPRKSSKKSARR